MLNVKIAIWMMAEKCKKNIARSVKYLLKITINLIEVQKQNARIFYICHSKKAGAGLATICMIVISTYRFLSWCVFPWWNEYTVLHQNQGGICEQCGTKFYLPSKFVEYFTVYLLFFSYCHFWHITLINQILPKKLWKTRKQVYHIRYYSDN